MPKGRVLVVDDQRYFRELLEGLLREADYEVRTAASGEEALEIFAGESFDVVITDLVMPGMDGSDLVHRVKQENANQDIVVVTGVVDVKTAVDAMKIGADEYLLKPIDASVLTSALDNLARRRATRDEHASLRAEHASLLQENIEFLGEQTLFARATDLFSCLELETLAARLLEELCRETQARGAAIWVACDGDASRLSLMATEGSARVEEEPQLLADSEVPEELRTGRARSVLDGLDVPESERAGLRLALAHRGKLIGLVRLSDKQGGGDFDDIDRSAAEKLARFGEIALNNALRIAALEGGSLQDPATGAYVYEFFQDAVRGEIEKSGRHGRSLSLMKVDLGPLDALRRRLGDAEFREWMATIVSQLEGQLRASDILASDGEGRFVVMFPDADEISAAALKYRAARTLERSASFPHLEPGERPARDLAIATYPVDGLQLESLRREPWPGNQPMAICVKVFAGARFQQQRR